MTLSIPDSTSIALRQAETGHTLSPELQLLLTCARLELTPPQQQRLRRLCGEITDWSALTRLADRHFILHLVYRHLRASASEAMPESVLAAMHPICQNRILRMIAIAGEQQRLVQRVLEPLGVPYALFKGPSLALRYYGELGLRQCSDIDVLIAPQYLVQVAEVLLAQGYTLDPGQLSDRYGTQALTAQDLGAACRYLNEVTMISPSGFCLELHRLIDSNGYLFRTDALLAKAESIQLNGVNCQVLPTTALFVYICYHHSRHQWSQLHWLVDLDAIQRHPSFDLEAVVAFAKRSGLGPTVAAALALHQTCAQAEPQLVPLANEQARSMRDACLYMLGASSAEQLALMQNRSTPDFNFDWQIHLWYRCYLVVQQIRPTYADYKAWPLPLSLHLLYYLVRPVRLAWKQIAHQVNSLVDI
jgi:hypothetical protein